MTHIRLQNLLGPFQPVSYPAVPDFRGPGYFQPCSGALPRLSATLNPRFPKIVGYLEPFMRHADKGIPYAYARSLIVE